MTVLDSAGRLLAGAGALAIWAAAFGMVVPTLDAMASFLPLSLAGLLIGLVAARLWRRAWWMLALTVSALPALYAIGHEIARPIPAARGEAELTLLTHNMHAANPDPAATVAAIGRTGADIVTLQEVTPGVRAMLVGPTGGYPHATPCPGDRCGLLIASRWPIEDSDYFLRDAAGERVGPPILWARIAAPGGAFTVATTHYPWPLPADRQAEKRRSLAQALARTDRDTLILAGDMNLTPWSAAMRAQDAGLAPLVRMTRSAFSWPGTVPILPIDQIYAGPDWTRVSVEALGPTGSDHRPILATLARR